MPQIGHFWWSFSTFMKNIEQCATWNKALCSLDLSILTINCSLVFFQWDSHLSYSPFICCVFPSVMRISWETSFVRVTEVKWKIDDTRCLFPVFKVSYSVVERHYVDLANVVRGSFLCSSSGPYSTSLYYLFQYVSCKLKHREKSVVT